jgi:hypothetical protein
MPFLEIYAYVGSALIAVSLMMTNIVPLRWINLVGAAVFSSYGLIIQAWPVFILNGFIVLIDIYHLFLLYRKPDQTQTTRLLAGNPYVTDILVEKWPQLNDVSSESEVEITFSGHKPTHFEVLT